ncbi:MAG TPA: DUF5690 family protein [Flavitalea sp.]|nr:DUF5690 family protein [Flavitalea sp.]
MLNSPVRKSFTARQRAVAVYTAVVVFITYASIFAYRKPFTVATFEGISFWGVPYQILLIISQVLGYMASKFYGIRYIAELRRWGRWKAVAILVGVAWLALLVFAITPPPYGMILFFLNGFPLGLLWGIIFSYVEGRRTTDFIGSALAVSFIFAGGFSRSVAKWLMINYDVSEAWVPFATGLVFAVPLILFLFLLERVPAPDADDISERTVRVPMPKEARKKFVREFGFGVVMVTITYLFLTIIRDLRDNFMANIWNELGFGGNASIFTKTETPTFILVLIMMSMLVLIRKNIIAFRIVHGMILFGFLLAGISSLLFLHGFCNPSLWMLLVGLGLYSAYIPFNSIFFERMIASFRITGNVGFLIYIADAFGYLGSVAVMLTKEILQVNLKWSEFYPVVVVVVAVIGVLGTISSLWYFNRKYKTFGVPSALFLVCWLHVAGCFSSLIILS